MRGVLSRGRRPPVNRPPSPPGRRWFRQPYRPSWPGHAASGCTATRETVPGGPHPRVRHPQEYYPLGRRLWGTARGTGCASGPRARWHPAPDWDNDSRPGTGLSPVTRTGDRCHRQPSGVNAVPRGRWQPSCCLRGGMVPPPRARPRPEPAGRDAAHPAPGPAVPRGLASRAPRARLQAPPQALSAPLSAAARAGAVATA